MRQHQLLVVSTYAVGSSLPLDHTRSSTKEEAAQRALTLLKNPSVEMCATRAVPPPAVNRKLLDDLEAALQHHGEKQGKMAENAMVPFTFEGPLAALCNAVAHPLAFALSFRRTAIITHQFLTSGADLDFDALKVLHKLAQDHEVVRVRLLQALVLPTEQIIRMNCVRSIGRAIWRGARSWSRR